MPIFWQNNFNQLNYFINWSYSFGGSSNGRTVAFEAINRGSNPCPPAMNIEQEKSALDSLLYEIWMFNETFSISDYISTPIAKRDACHNALLESFLIHARNLFNFLEDKIKKDDIRISDFSINKITVNLPQDNSIHDINKYLTHLTKKRIQNNKPKWKLGEIKKEINEKIHKFLDQLPPDLFPTKERKEKSDFKSYLTL